jgi:hypothetical protein
MEDDYDDRFDSEREEDAISKRRYDDCMRAYGLPYDPYADGEDEE